MNPGSIEFCDSLAAQTSSPGGGTAAAYVGALAVALGSMASRFSCVHVDNPEDEAFLQEGLAECETLRKRFFELADMDAHVLAPLMQAYKMDASDPVRADTLEAALKTALEPPLETMRGAKRCIELIERLSQKSTRLLASDIGCAAAFASAALQAASLNVLVNVRSLHDRSFAQSVLEERRELISVIPRAQVIVSNVAELLQK